MTAYLPEDLWRIALGFLPRAEELAVATFLGLPYHIPVSRSVWWGVATHYAALGDTEGCRLIAGTLDSYTQWLMLRSAVQHGHDKVVRLCHGWGIYDLIQTIEEAATYGHASIVRLCHELGGDMPVIQTAIGNAMIRGAMYGHENIVHLCHELGATTTDTAMLEAVSLNMDP